VSKVLITGVAGLLGNNFSRYLLDPGHEVIGIDDLSGGYEEYVDRRVNFYRADLNHEFHIDEIFRREEPDYVYHFAAYAAVCLSPFIRRHNYVNNVVCSATVINACIKHNVKKLIFTSSMDVYGENQVPFQEHLTPKPEDPYGISKYAIEMDLAAAHKDFGLRYSIVRPHNVVGVYQNIWDRYRNVFGIWIRKAINGEPITVYGDGTQVRSFSDIGFYMEPFEKLMESHDSEIFNIGADQYCTINEAANMFIDVASEFGYQCEKVHLEARNEVHTAYCDHTKAKELLGFEDGTDLKETIRDMFGWAIEQPSRDVKSMPYELEKGMYSYWRNGESSI
jgi:UDP-glucose 4-epimerase